MISLQRKPIRSQKQLILTALSLGGYWSEPELQNFTAKNKNKSKRIAARVNDLRNDGHDIQGAFRKFPVYEYWMVK